VENASLTFFHSLVSHRRQPWRWSLSASRLEFELEVLSNANDLCLKKLCQAQRRSDRREATVAGAHDAPPRAFLNAIGEQQKPRPAGAGPAAAEILADGEGVGRGAISLDSQW